MNEAQARTGESPVRASDAERDRTAEILQTGYAEGRLTRAELDDRIAAAYAATTLGDLRRLTGDQPAAPPRPAVRDQAGMVYLPIADRAPGPGTGPGTDRCLLFCLLCAFPPAGIVYWILSSRRRAQLAAQ
jgi:hypothetical protein